MKKKVNAFSKKEVKIRPNEKFFKEYKVPSKCLLFDFLLQTLTSKSRNNIKQLLKNHQILVNGAPISQFDFELIAKDIVSISPYPVKKNGKRISKLPILYEDDELLVINKPSGLLSIADDKDKEHTAYRYMMDYVREENPKNRIFVVHRIDKETSGVMIFTKSSELKDALQDKWNQLVKLREYIAICEGHFENKEGTRISNLLQAKTNLMYSTKNPKEGLKAITHYWVMEEILDYSLLRVHIDTGRKNQIRVHMKDLGHNVVGDDKYGSTLDPIKRLGLHARILEFDHPNKDKHFKFIADVPKEFLTLFNLKRIK
ncbi:MAG: RluA family pseudouridine synthase [Erysipelotrichaceae bacterium]|nr:RluA family pseudouridine synthase [Erysipelotrichaceae bacterium]